MKHLNEYIIEKFKIGKQTIQKQYTYSPKTKEELQKIIQERLRKDMDSDFNDIDVSNITDMKELFMPFNPKNVGISEWDVSNVKDMESMFEDCIAFNADISNWNVSKCENMKHMFDCCHRFTCDLSNWNVSNVTNMDHMFRECESLDKYPEWYDAEL